MLAVTFWITRSWVRRLVIRSRCRELGLGAATLVPLAKAREQALANRMLAGLGPFPNKVARCRGTVQLLWRIDWPCAA